MRESVRVKGGERVCVSVRGKGKGRNKGNKGRKQVESGA